MERIAKGTGVHLSTQQAHAFINRGRKTPNSEIGVGSQNKLEKETGSEMTGQATQPTGRELVIPRESQCEAQSTALNLFAVICCFVLGNNIVHLKIVIESLVNDFSI